MRQAKLKQFADIVYKSGKPAVTSLNHLEQQFEVIRPYYEVWVTEITQIKAYEGWLYVAVVVELYSRALVGWAMRGNMRAETVLDAVLLAKRRRQPQHSVIHSD